MSLMGQSRHIQRTPKTNFVRFNNGQTRARWDCPLCANRDQRAAANSISIQSTRQRRLAT
jgi:hypothetical protein